MFVTVEEYCILASDVACGLLTLHRNVFLLMYVKQQRYSFGCGGLAIGLFVGIMLGWLFHGFVGLVIRFGIVMTLLVPLAFALWFIYKAFGSSRSAPTQVDDIPEAEWHEISGPGR
jgi:hypothetical protein